MKPEESLKYFGLNNLLVETSIRKIEGDLGYDLGHKDDKKTYIDETYYPQFKEKVRKEASEMAIHYRIFYCLENSIRELIATRLFDEYGENWWADKVPEDIQKKAKNNREKEIKSAVTPRSDELIDYTTFGELANIINSNKGAFGDQFNSFEAVERVLAQLNLLRGPIAHCKPLAEDEVIRLHLTLRSWFRALGE